MGPLELLEPFLAEAQDQLAARRSGGSREDAPGRPGPARRPPRPARLRPRAGEGLLGLVQHHDQRPVDASPRIDPEAIQVGSRSSARVGRQAAEQACRAGPVGLAPEVDDPVRRLQPGPQAGVEDRRLAHAGRAGVEDHRPGRWRGRQVVERADGLAAAEEDGGLLAGERLQVAVGRRRQALALRHFRQAEQRVAGQLGEADVLDMLDPSLDRRTQGKPRSSVMSSGANSTRLADHVAGREPAAGRLTSSWACRRRRGPSSRPRASCRSPPRTGKPRRRRSAAPWPRRRRPPPEQVVDLGLGGAAVEEDQAEPPLAPREPQQSPEIGLASPCRRRCEQEAVLIGMAAIVEDRHPPLVFLEDLVDVVERGVDHELGLAERPGPASARSPTAASVPGPGGQGSAPPHTRWRRPGRSPASRPCCHLSGPEGPPSSARIAVEVASMITDDTRAGTGPTGG